MIDFHCHLDLYPDPAAIVAECRSRNIYILSVTTTPSAWEGTSALVPNCERIRTAVGLHPQIAHERHEELGLFDELIGLTDYVGEIGLDGGPELRQHRDIQLRVFNHILETCFRSGGRIMSIHSRRAGSEVLDCLKSHPDSGIPVLHWFSGSERELERAIAMNCWFSVGPAMLASERGRALTTRIPRERLLTESDGPFAQILGRTIYPWDINDAVAEIAVLWNASVEEVSARLHDNLRALAVLRNQLAA